MEEDRGTRHIQNMITLEEVTPISMSSFADSIGVSADFLIDLGINTSELNGKMVIGIPYYDQNGVVVAKKHFSPIGNIWVPSNPEPELALMYCNWELMSNTSQSSILLVQNELDCIVSWSHKIKALYIPSSAVIDDPGVKQCLYGSSTIYIFKTKDNPDDSILLKLKLSSLVQRIKVINALNYQSLSDMHLKNKDKFTIRLKNAKGTALALSCYTTRKSSELLESCKEIAGSENIFDLLSSKLTSLGYVGEERTTKLLYLCMVSSITMNPISIAVKGASSAGKSHAVKTVLQFFPSDICHQFTGMSQKALFYSDVDFKHKIIWVYEADGYLGKENEYIIRTFLSEGKLCYTTVKSMKTTRIEKDGPIGLILTSTIRQFNHENETRLFSVYVDESSAHTNRVLKKVRI